MAATNKKAAENIQKAAAPMKKIIKTLKLSPVNIEQAEAIRMVWSVMPDPEVTVDDMLKPDYWAHVAMKLRPGDRIEAMPADRNYLAKFIVLGRDRLWAKVVLISYVVVYDKDEVPADEGYIVSFVPSQKWRVVKGNDVLTKDHDDKQSALVWLKEHRKAIA